MANLSQSEVKMLGLQSQIRENQRDLGDFLKDLDSWESDIKQKDQELKKTKVIEEPNLPPVRNSLHRKKKRVKKKAHGESVKKASPSKSKKISGYDFRAWDKFDVEKACEELDSDGNEAQESASDETDEEWEIERKKQQAILEKDNGNDYFKKGDYGAAIECYTLGINLDPTNPLLSANRAMALIKQEKFAAAEEDSTLSLSLDPLYIKAYLRRGTARIGLGKLDEAKADFEKVLKLEPQNKQASLELEKIKKAEDKEKLVTHGSKSSDVGIVRAITKPVGERSKKPLKRLDIEETGFDDHDARQGAIAKIVESQSETKKTLTIKDDKLFQKFTKSEEQRNGTSTQERLGPDKIMEEGLSTKTKSDLNTEKLTNSSSSRAQSGELMTESLPLPETSYQFQADCKLLKNNSKAFYEYFKRIPPVSYSRLFGESLESGILMAVLKTFQEFFIPAQEKYSEHLLQLARVKRFSTIIMFLSNSEKIVISELYRNLKSGGNVCEEDLNMIAKKFEIKS